MLARGLIHRKGIGNVALRRDVEPELSKLKALLRERNGSVLPTWSYGILSRVEKVLMSASVFSVKASSLSRYNSLEVEGLFSSRLVMKTQLNGGLGTIQNTVGCRQIVERHTKLSLYNTIRCPSRVPLNGPMETPDGRLPRRRLMTLSTLYRI